MATDVDMARETVAAARTMFAGLVEKLSLEEALFAGGGWRSGLGVLKHLGGWLYVYHSYAFEAQPKHWAQVAWPKGLIDEVEFSPEYLRTVVAWIVEGFGAWDDALASVGEGRLDEPRPVHWGGELPLSRIVALSMQHTTFHSGEMNMLLSIKRGEAWEWTEEVEENHIDTMGHSVRPGWMNDETAARYTAYMAGRRAGRATRT